MKTVNKVELSAILAGLRLLQIHGYPAEYEVEGKMSVDEIDELCESINCEPFSSLPLKEEEIEIWQFISDTNEGTQCSLYQSQEEAEMAFIASVVNYPSVRETLDDDGIKAPTYKEALNAWEYATENGIGVIDTIFIDVQTVRFAINAESGKTGEA